MLYMYKKYLTNRFIHDLFIVNKATAVAEIELVLPLLSAWDLDIGI